MHWSNNIERNKRFLFALFSGISKAVSRDLYSPKIGLKNPDAAFVAKLVNVILYGCKRATAQFITRVYRMLYLHNDIFLTDMTYNVFSGTLNPTQSILLIS